MMDFIVEPNAEGGADVVAVHRCKVATFVERDAADAYADWRRAEHAAVDQRYAVWLTGRGGASMSVDWVAMTRAETGVTQEDVGDALDRLEAEMEAEIAAEEAAEGRAELGECCERCGDPMGDSEGCCSGCPPEDPVNQAEPSAAAHPGAALARAHAAPLPEAVAHLVSACPVDPYAPDGEAMQRLQAGEKVNVVADELGLNPHRLRGHWSRRQVALRDAAAPSRDRPVMDDAVPPTRAQPPKLATPAAPAPQPAEGWVVCRRCKVEFNAAKAQKLHKLDEQPTLCAACRAVAA